MKEQPENTIVAEYYGSVENRLWDAVTNGHIHLGYWDRSSKDATFAQGTYRLTELMISKTKIVNNQRFCDIGCGVGLPAMRLAQSKACYVNGITISPYQQTQARIRAKENGLDNQVCVLLADALHLPFKDNSFDGGWFFESIFHMGHKSALLEAQRVLKPGSELLIADVVDIGALSQEKKELAKTLCNAVYIPADTYPGLLESTGFECLELTDVTKEVMDPFESKFIEAVEQQKEMLSSIANPEIIEAFKHIAGQLASTAGYIIVKAKRM